MNLEILSLIICNIEFGVVGVKVICLRTRSFYTLTTRLCLANIF